MLSRQGLRNSPDVRRKRRSRQGHLNARANESVQQKIESELTMGRTPDAFEIKVRFGCGALLGLVVGLGMCVGLSPLSTLGACMLVGIPVVACGASAACFGDSFWAHLHWLR